MRIQIGLVAAPFLVGVGVGIGDVPARAADEALGPDPQRVGALAYEDGQPMLAVLLPYPVGADLGDILQAAFALAQSNGARAHARFEVLGGVGEASRYRGEPPAQSARLQEKDGEDAACGHQPADSAGVKPEVERSGTEQRAERKAEQPGAHCDDHPEIENRAAPPARQDDKSEEVQATDGRGGQFKRRRRDAGDDCRRRRGAARRQQRQQSGKAGGRGDGLPGAPAVAISAAARSAAAVEGGIGDHEQRKTALPEDEKPGARLAVGAEPSGR